MMAEFMLRNEVSLTCTISAFGIMLSVAGITALVRSGGWAAAPIFAGMMMQAGGLGLPLVFAGITKLSYDLLLWREFRRVKPPEELSG